MNIQGKVAVITGGASGLGQATAEAIIAKGGKVMILDRDEKKGPEAVSYTHLTLPTILLV